MHDGYYWIQYGERKDIAYYSDEQLEDIETGEITSGLWRIVRCAGNILSRNEVEVLSGPLSFQDQE
jgi:hypothetical protein